MTGPESCEQSRPISGAREGEASKQRQPLLGFQGWSWEEGECQTHFHPSFYLLVGQECCLPQKWVALLSRLSQYEFCGKSTGLGSCPRTASGWMWGRRWKPAVGKKLYSLDFNSEVWAPTFSVLHWITQSPLVSLGKLAESEVRKELIC